MPTREKTGRQEDMPQQNWDHIADARPDNWVDRHAPRAAVPYLRLARFDRPVGSWLLLWPCLWSLALAGPGWQQGLWYAALFAAGAVIMRGAGCVINDIADRKFDARVERTRNRPLAAGHVSVTRALVWLAMLGAAGLIVLLQFNRFTVWLGIASLAIVIVYPFMKRITYWPQVVLGLAFNWGALLGWSAVRGTLESPALALYFGGLFWTLGYDTIYAHQDRDDDMLVGIKSTALRLGEDSRIWIGGFYLLATLLFAGAGWLAGAGPFYFAGCVLVATHFAWQIWRLDIDNPALCLKLFKSNILLGGLLLAAILADRLA